MSNISSSLIGMLYNFTADALSGRGRRGDYGVLMYVQFIFVAIFIGYSIGCAPIISYHYGAQHPELKNLLTKGVLIDGHLGHRDDNRCHLAVWDAGKLLRRL